VSIFRLPDTSLDKRRSQILILIFAEVLGLYGMPITTRLA